MNAEESKGWFGQFIRKYEKVTKASHFVKKEYLKGWSSDGKHVLTSFKGGPFHPETLDSVCFENYMYKLERLTDLELEQIRSIYKDSPPIVRQLNDSFLCSWQALCSLASATDPPRFVSLIERIKTQAGEDVQSAFERELQPEIKSNLFMLSESFLRNDDKLLSFGLYIFSQFFRTQKNRDVIVKNFDRFAYSTDELNKLDAKRIWKPLIAIMTNMAAYHLLGKDNLHICFIMGNGNQIMTADQPILNIARNINVDYAKFYYPLSPSLAIVFPYDNYRVIDGDDLLISKMNRLIQKESVRATFKYG